MLQRAPPRTSRTRSQAACGRRGRGAFPARENLVLLGDLSIGQPGEAFDATFAAEADELRKLKP
jgi:hypothetical protein